MESSLVLLCHMKSSLISPTVRDKTPRMRILSWEDTDLPLLRTFNRFACRAVTRVPISLSRLCRSGTLLIHAVDAPRVSYRQRRSQSDIGVWPYSQTCDPGSHHGRSRRLLLCLQSSGFDNRNLIRMFGVSEKAGSSPSVSVRFFLVADLFSMIGTSSQFSGLLAKSGSYGCLKETRED